VSHVVHNNRKFSFPYEDSQPQSDLYTSIYRFLLPNDQRAHGFMLPAIVEAMPWTPEFHIDHERKTAQLCLPSDNSADIALLCNAALQKLVDIAIEKNIFRVIHGKHSELYPIIGSKFPVSVERFSSSLFGIISRGAHMTVYTRTNGGMKIWVPRRSSSLFTYPGYLDTTVAGGVTAGESPFECIVREAEEEASIPEDLVRREARPTGLLSYIRLNDERGGGELGLIAPDILHVYDLEVAEDMQCRPHDDEVKEFYLMTVDEVRQALLNEEFKTNCALVMIDFFIRHGYITEDNEEQYVEIATRLHRKLPFPTSP
jgi:8-oxo-dGTP pyrophosphatase MutT (NUDIX family)